MLPAGNSVFKTVCPDKHCQSVLYVYSSDRIVECFQCGQKHSKESFRDLREVPSEQVKGALQGYLYRMLINRSTPKRGTEMVKVLGLSNYHCKILSPHLTTHGMDKNTGRAILLTEMNQGKMFDCSLLSDRAFLIEPEHISIHGYGKDITGSIDYLSETLKQIIDHNGGEERLIPIHSDGDGHCLVHAISRALVGRELFWHPLRCCLKQHFKTNLDNYKVCKQFFYISYIIQHAIITYTMKSVSGRLCIKQKHIYIYRTYLLHMTQSTIVRTLQIRRYRQAQSYIPYSSADIWRAFASLLCVSCRTDKYHIYKIFQ